MSKIPLSILSLKSYLISLSSHYKLFSEKPLTVQHKSEYPIYKKAIDEVIARIENNFCNYDNDGWISVDDWLPEPEIDCSREFKPTKFYLIQLKSGLIDIAAFVNIYYDAGDNRDEFVVCTINSENNKYVVQEYGQWQYDINEVKCWQLLPNPSKE